MEQKTLREASKTFESKKTKNIADLEVVNLDNLVLETKEGINDEGKPFSYQVVSLNGTDYRVPASVLSNIKTILEAKPSLKTVKVIKKGQGMNTEYTVIPLD